MTVEEAPIPRMKAEDRRELILAAATGVFGDFGYVGTTTDQIVRAAGVSQPYVVRMFGTKEKLFLEVLKNALDRIFEVFGTALAADSDLPVERRLGLAYFGLLSEHGLLLSLMHSFVLGNDPAIGQAARAGFLAVYNYLRDEGGFSSEQAQDFLAQGMLANTMIGLRMTDWVDDDPRAAELLEICFPGKLSIVLELGDLHRPAKK